MQNNTKAEPSGEIQSIIDSFNPFTSDGVEATSLIAEDLKTSGSSVSNAELNLFITLLFTSFQWGMRLKEGEDWNSDTFKIGMKEIFSYMAKNSQTQQDVNLTFIAIGQFAWTMSKVERAQLSNELYKRKFELGECLETILDDINQVKGFTSREEFISHYVNFYRETQNFNQIRRIYIAIQELDSDVVTKNENFFSFMQPFVDAAKVSDSKFPISLVQEIEKFTEDQDLAEELIIKYAEINYAKLAEPDEEDEKDNRERNIKEFTESFVLPFITEKIAAGEYLAKVWDKIERFMVRKIDLKNTKGEFIKTYYGRTPYAQVIFDAIESQFSGLKDAEALLRMVETVKNAWLKAPSWIRANIQASQLPASISSEAERFLKVEIDDAHYVLERISEFYEKRKIPKEQ